MRVIKLCHGEGNSVDTACLMSASSMLMGKRGDDNECVCDLLRAFIIRTNDYMPLHLLSEIYGPLVWEILGTKTNDRAVKKKRALAFLDWGFRVVLPRLPIEVFQNIPPIETIEQARYFGSVAMDVANSVKGYTIHQICSAMFRASTYRELEDIPAAVATAVTYAGCWDKCPDIIRRVAAIGDKRPVETVINHDQLAEMLT